MVLGQLVPATHQPQRKSSFEAPPKDSIVRKLSFASASSHPASQPEQAEGDEQIVPASPQQQEEASPKEETEEAASSSQPTASAAQSALPQPGSATIIGISGEDRYRITNDARQLLHSVYAQKLRIHPALRRAQLRRMGAAEYKSKKENH